MSKDNIKWRTVKYKKIIVYYLPILDGGGRDQFSQDFIPLVKEKFGKVKKICEFGSGPGFIGFSLLAHGLCEKLVLIDINPLAIEACKQTIKKNKLEDKVTTYVSDVLESVSDKEKWDLVVSNPPHFDGKYTNHPAESLIIDPGWIVHRKFYSKIAKHLERNGSVLFVENGHGSNTETFKKMITRNGLKIIKSFQRKPSLSKILLQNLKVLKNRITLKNIKYLLSLFRRMSIKPAKVLLLNEYPFYFIWSRRK